MKIQILVGCGLWALSRAALAQAGRVETAPPAHESGEKLGRLAPRTPDLWREKTLFAVSCAPLETQRQSQLQLIRDWPDTLHRQFALFEKYPNLIFNSPGARRYQMLREYYPADYAHLKRYANAGRWFPSGAAVEEADVWVPGLESLVRQTLYGNRFFRREWGVESQNFELPDGAGIPAALPSILAHCGLQGFSAQKSVSAGATKNFPFSVGNWVGPDGKSVIAALDWGTSGATVGEDLSQSAFWRARVEANGQKSGVFADFLRFEPSEDSARWMEKSLRANGALKIVAATGDQMFRAMSAGQKKRLPAFRGEWLATNAADSFASQAILKRWNRKNELLADAAERASVAALWLGGSKYPAPKLENSWNLLLGNQSPALLSGNATPQSTEFAWNDAILAQNGFAAALENGVATLAGGLDTRAQKGVSLVVYNPLSWAREDIVEATVRFARGVPQNVSVVGPDGKIVASQLISRANSSLKIAFLARVPSVGAAVFHVIPTRPDELNVGSAMKKRNGQIPPLKIARNFLENARFCVKINAAGDVFSIYDKKLRRETLKSALRLAFWSETPAPDFVDSAATVKIIENGPARVTLEISRLARGSRFVQRISLCDGEAGNQIDFALTMDWTTRGATLKAVFPFAAANFQATYDSQLGIVARGNQLFEVSQHQWFDLTDKNGKWGVAVLNDGNYGSDKPDENTLRLSLLHTPAHARQGYSDQTTQNFGRHQMRFSLAPHAGDWRPANAIGRAARLNQPLRAFQTTSHAGNLGKSFSFLQMSAPNVCVVALKKAEDSGEIIVRLRETHGKTVKNGCLRLAGAVISAREVDGQERSIGSAKVQNGVINIDLNAYGLRAFALKIAPPTGKLSAPISQSVTLPFDLDAISRDGDWRDGSFDEQNRTLAGEEFPARIESGNVVFRTGSSAPRAKNALRCRAQSLALPQGNWNRVYLLAASIGGDQNGEFRLGNRVISRKIGDWSGFVGAFDSRVWNGPQRENANDWTGNVGLKPGFIKTQTVAWQASHRHHPARGNEIYHRSYLFQIGFDLGGARQLVLPDNPKIRVFALSVARETAAQTTSAAPLFDDLSGRETEAPRLNFHRTFNDSARVEIQNGLYGGAGGLRYSLDGRTPTLASPLYERPFFLARSTTIAARSFDPNGVGGPTARGFFAVNDLTAPKIVAAHSDGFSPSLEARFSEPVEPFSASNAANYELIFDGAKIESALLNPDGQSVQLHLSRPINSKSQALLRAKNVADRSPRANVAIQTLFPVLLSHPVLELSAPQIFDGRGDGFSVRGAAFLPTAPSAPWTINQWVFLEKQPQEFTILGGFGDAREVRGTQRFLVKYRGAIYFLGAGADLGTDTPFDVGRWQMITLTFDGQILRIWKDGREIQSGNVVFNAAAPMARLAPPNPLSDGARFAGKIAGFSIWDKALSSEAIAALLKKSP